MRRIITALVLPISIFFTACSGGSGSPEGVIGDFVAASKAGDVDKARSFVVKAERGDFKIQAGGMQDDVVIGTAKVDGERAVVPCTVKGQPEAKMVLVMEDGVWRLSMAETLKEMLGLDPAKMMEAMGDGLGQGMEEAMKNMGEGMDDAMKKAVEQMKKR